MPFNGSGSFQPPGANFPAVSNTLIQSADYNAVINDIATGLSTCLTKDGQTTPTANLPMGGFRHTGVGNAQARPDYAAAGQVQDGTLNWKAAAGTSDALTVAYAPALAALVDGQLCCVRVASANTTTTPTFAPNGITAHPITKLGGAAVEEGEWGADQELILRYNLADTRWELLNPRKVASSDITGLLDAANIWTADQTIQSTDPGASEGPSLILDRNSASPAVNDLIGAFVFKARNSLAAAKNYLRVLGQILDPTSGAESAQYQFNYLNAGAEATSFRAGAGIAVGAAAGGLKGAGTVNASHFYKDGVELPSAKQAAQAWVNFNGTGTVAIRSSFNVSSITDNGTGDWTANLTTAMPDTNYAVVTGTSTTANSRTNTANLSTLAVGSVRLKSSEFNSTAYVSVDLDTVCVAIFC